MDSVNNTEKGYTDEQWEALLNQTFGDPTPVPKAPVPKPEAPEQETPDPDTREPETAEKGTSMPAEPVARKKRKVSIVLWILLAVFLALAILAVHISPRESDDPIITEEQQQCMEALRQWQEAQYYQISTAKTIFVQGSYAFDSVPIVESVYYHGENRALNWEYTRYSTINSGNQLNNYAGQAKIDGQLYTYAGNSLRAGLWKTTGEASEISPPWIMSFSFNNVQIIDQHRYKSTADNMTVISFSVMDTDPDAAYYDQGPYRVNFLFNDKGFFYGVTHYHSHYMTNLMTITAYNLTEFSADYVEKRIQSQISNPTAYPGLSFDSTVPAINITVEE